MRVKRAIVVPNRAVNEAGTRVQSSKLPITNQIQTNCILKNVPMQSGCGIFFSSNQPRIAIEMEREIQFGESQNLLNNIDNNCLGMKFARQ